MSQSSKKVNEQLTEEVKAERHQVSPENTKESEFAASINEPE